MSDDNKNAPSEPTHGWEEIKELIGQTLKAVTRNSDDDRLTFTLEDGREYEFLHHQDCCEWVAINEVIGDLTDLLGSPIIRAEEVWQSNSDNGDSMTWTFYRFATGRGAVTVRWLGQSNGYYSERVSHGWAS